MTNPMLAELDEVVRLIAKEEKEEAGKPLSILRDNEELDNACYWFAKNHHATLADMAKRLEAAERDAGRWRHFRKELALGRAEIFGAMNDAIPDDATDVPEVIEPLIDKGMDAAIDATQEGDG